MRRPLALFALFSLLPLVVLGVILTALSMRARQAALEHQAEAQAGFVSTLIGRELANDLRTAQLLTLSPAFDHGFDPARFALLAQRLLGEEPIWRAVSVADPSGRRVLDLPKPIAGGPGRVVDPESLQQAVRTRRPTVGAAVLGPRGHPGFALRAPVLRDGRVPYVVSVVVNPSTLNDLLQPGDLPQDWIVEVIDGGGRIVAFTGSRQVMAGQRASRSLAAWRPERGVQHGTTLYGRPVVGVARALPHSDWTVLVAMPERDYAAPQRREIQALVIGVVVSLVLAALLGLLLARELRQHRAREAAALDGQRLEALGRMTGGVAHDLNNLLTPIIGGMDLLQRRVAADAASVRLVETVQASAQRAKTLVGQLLAFARRQPLEPKNVDVAALLANVRELIERSVGPGIKVLVTVSGPLAPARVDPTQLELALVNLAVNARDAMPTGGMLAIEAREAEPGQNGPELPAGRYLRISVTDTGSGMDAATLQKAIEPFFTTKAHGAGTGLGLSMVHGLAAQSGGALKLTSTRGAGTTAEIWLPVGEGAAERDPAPEALQASRTGRILVVDDQDLVRGSIGEMLRDRGHEVIEADSLDAAMALLRAGEGVDVMVTDHAMPGGDGAQLIAAARALRPGLPVLLVSAYAGPEVEAAADVVRLAKPFRRNELLNRVGALLGGT